MKSISEPIARKANEEDKVSGRLWEGRFGCHALLSEKLILAAMTYVDLNAVRAKIARNIATSRYTSVKMRNQQLRKKSRAREYAFDAACRPSIFQFAGHLGGGLH